MIQFLNWITGRAKRQAEAEKTEAEAAKTEAEARRTDAEADESINRMVNEKIKSLLYHYEKRVEDLMEEVHGLRAEVVKLRQALDERPHRHDGFGA